MSTLAVASHHPRAGRPGPLAVRRVPSAVDRHVGARVRMRRLQLGLSQETLSKRLDLTFQQLQKYEKGTNRIGAGRLLQLSEVLQVTVSFFFEGAPGATAPRQPAGLDLDPLMTLGMTREGLTLATAYNAITSRAERDVVVRMAEMLAERSKR